MNTCDNCAYRGCGVKTVEWWEDNHRYEVDRSVDASIYDDIEEDEKGRAWRTEPMMLIADRAYDACFFNPEPVECPPQNWCGRYIMSMTECRRRRDRATMRLKQSKSTMESFAAIFGEE